MDYFIEWTAPPPVSKQVLVDQPGCSAFGMDMFFRPVFDLWPQGLPTLPICRSSSWVQKSPAFLQDLLRLQKENYSVGESTDF